MIQIAAFPYVYNNISYRTGQYVDPQFPGMKPVLCLFKDNTSFHPVCTMIVGDVYAIPVFNHAGNSFTMPEPCNCTEQLQGDVATNPYNLCKLYTVVCCMLCACAVWCLFVCVCVYVCSVLQDSVLCAFMRESILVLPRVTSLVHLLYIVVVLKEINTFSCQVSTLHTFTDCITLLYISHTLHTTHYTHYTLPQATSLTSSRGSCSTPLTTSTPTPYLICFSNTLITPAAPSTN